jgi:hypothetical protein
MAPDSEDYDGLDAGKAVPMLFDGWGFTPFQAAAADSPVKSASEAARDGAVELADQPA